MKYYNWHFSLSRNYSVIVAQNCCKFIMNIVTSLFQSKIVEPCFGTWICFRYRFLHDFSIISATTSKKCCSKYLSQQLLIINIYIIFNDWGSKIIIDLTLMILHIWTFRQCICIIICTYMYIDNCSNENPLSKKNRDLISILHFLLILTTQSNHIHTINICITLII